MLKNIPTNINTPIGFFSLVVLIIESILGGLALVSSTENQTFIIRSMIFILITVIIIVTTLAYKKPEFFNHNSSKKTAKSSLPYEYDIFLSSPMAAFSSNEEYQNERQQMLELLRAFSDYCQFDKTYYAGATLESQEDFSSDVISAAEKDFIAIEKSKYFILIYPQRLASGVLVEIGYALALNKPTIIFVKNRQDLPYLLNHLHGFRDVEIYDYKNLHDIKNMIVKNGCTFLKL